MNYPQGSRMFIEHEGHYDRRRKGEEMNYTKSPWEVIQRAVDGETHVISADGYFIANCGHTGKDERLPYNREALDNARLIVSAPEMYEELDRIYQWCLERSMASHDLYDKLARRIMPILVKVEGKETRV